MLLDICFSPALYSYYGQPEDIVIITDIYRATTTMCMALNNGASAIIPVADIEEAEQYKKEGFLVGAERNTKKCSFADFGNSPFEYTTGQVAGKEIVFTTTNGTRALHATKDYRELFIGAFSNIDVLVERCIELDGRIVIICAGWNNKVNSEDMLFAGAFAERLCAKTDAKIESDAGRIALDLWNVTKGDLTAYIKNTDHYSRLMANGLERDAAFCLEQNTVPLVPYYDKDGKIKVG